MAIDPSIEQEQRAAIEKLLRELDCALEELEKQVRTNRYPSPLVSRTNFIELANSENITPNSPTIS